MVNNKHKTSYQIHTIKHYLYETKLQKRTSNRH